MTKALLAPPCSSPKLTQREMCVELERLAILFPRTDMDARKWQELFRTYWTDLNHLSLNELRDACRRYRTRAEHRFFPTPGQLLAMVEREPVDRHRHSRGDDVAAPIGTRLTPERAAEIKRAAGFEDVMETAAVPAPQPWTPAELDRFRELKGLRAAALQRRLAEKQRGGSAG